MKLRATHLLIVPLTIAAALLTVLSLRYSDLQERYADLTERAFEPHAGLFVPAYQAETLDGDTVTLGMSEPREAQILIFFTTTCGYCRASLPAFRTIAAARDEAAVAVLGVSLDSIGPTRTYASEHGLTFPIVPLPMRKIAQFYRVRGVPLVLAVNFEGRVLYARRGVIERRSAIDSVLEAAAAAVSSVVTPRIIPEPAGDAARSAGLPTPATASRAGVSTLSHGRSP